jgi:outer membrane biosynthesis protein TonB
MRAARTKIGILALALLIVLSGCKKKKPNIPPPQQQAPTITQPQQQQPPVQQPPVQTPQPQPQPPAPTTTQPEPAAPTTATKPKPKPHKHHVAKKPVEPKGNKTVIKEGGENASGQLSASIPANEASQQRQTTAQLRQATENNLKSITRQLSGDEQSMVQQIRTYLSQSRAADNDGDTERAYNLALKARLLSDELVKQ